MSRLVANLVVQRGAFSVRAAFEADGPIALVGPNGAGKTTLLRALAGAGRAEGRVAVGERELLDSARGLRVPPEERGVGYLPQGCGLFPHLSVRGNVAYGLASLSGLDRDGRVQSALAQAGASHLGGRRPRTLSGGERQRVALARALATQPSLLLLDEPTASLDVQSQASVRDLLSATLRRPGCAAVVVTHDLRDLRAWQPHIVVLDAGRVVCSGSLEAIAQSEHPFVRALVQS